VPGSAPRRMWLDCPEGAVALQLTASTSAGEGRRGGRVCSQHKSSGGRSPAAIALKSTSMNRIKADNEPLSGSLLVSCSRPGGRDGFHHRPLHRDRSQPDVLELCAAKVSTFTQSSTTDTRWSRRKDSDREHRFRPSNGFITCVQVSV